MHRSSTPQTPYYRAISISEADQDSMFHSLRYFPQLHKSVSEISSVRPNYEGKKVINNSVAVVEFKREKKVSYTHHLDELKSSSLSEFTALDDFRKVLVSDRLKDRTTKTPKLTARASLALEDGEDILRVANEKLARHAVSYDARSFINVLAAFQGTRGGWINKEQFRVQLRRCLNINLVQCEFDAIFDKIDDNHNGLIEGVEFTRYFFKLGNAARRRALKENEDRHKRREQEDKLKMEREDEKMKRWEDEQSKLWEEHANSESAVELLDFIMEKLSLIAVETPLNSPAGQIINSAFENHLRPIELKQQVEKAFNVRLSEAEAAVLTSRFSTLPGTHCVDGRLFLKQLYMLGQRTLETLAAEREKISRRLRKDAVWSKNQKVDCLPKILGR